MDAVMNLLKLALVWDHWRPVWAVAAWTVAGRPDFHRQRFVRGLGHHPQRLALKSSGICLSPPLGPQTGSTNMCGWDHLWSAPKATAGNVDRCFGLVVLLLPVMALSGSAGRPFFSMYQSGEAG
jgi:hypothetical protein